MDDEQGKWLTDAPEWMALDEDETPLAETRGQAEELPHIEVEFELTADEVWSGQRLFQKKVLFRCNMIFTVVFFIAAALYGYAQLVSQHRMIFAFVGIILCAVLLFYVLFQVRHREKLVRIMSQAENKFIIDLYEKYVYIWEEHCASKVLYKKSTMFAIEDYEKFVICIQSKRIYVLPKRSLTEGQRKQIREYFTALGARFKIMEYV